MANAMTEAERAAAIKTANQACVRVLDDNRLVFLDQHGLRSEFKPTLVDPPKLSVIDVPIPKELDPERPASPPLPPSEPAAPDSKLKTVALFAGAAIGGAAALGGATALYHGLTDRKPIVEPAGPSEVDVLKWLREHGQDRPPEGD